MKPKSRSQIEVEHMIARRIAAAVSFSAHLRQGPYERYTTRDLPAYEAAVAEAERITAAHGRFGKKAVVYAIGKDGVEEMCTPELVELARTLGDA